MSAVKAARYALADDRNARSLSGWERLGLSSIALHDIENPPAFARKLLLTENALLGGFFTPGDFDDVVAAVVDWMYGVAAPKYERLGGFPTFSSYVGEYGPKKMIDWMRKNKGDARYGQWLGSPWLQGKKGCKHQRDRETNTCLLCAAAYCLHELDSESGRCETCYCVWVGNDDRCESVADPSELSPAIEDEAEIVTLIEEMDSERLSPRSRQMLHQVARMKAEDPSRPISDIADELAEHKKGKRGVPESMKFLRKELVA